MKEGTASVQNAVEVLESAIKEPTLDEIMRRDPKDLSDADLLALIEHQRTARAAFHIAEKKRKEAKAGVEEPAEEEESE